MTLIEAIKSGRPIVKDGVTYYHDQHMTFTVEEVMYTGWEIEDKFVTINAEDLAKAWDSVDSRFGGEYGNGLRLRLLRTALGL